MSSQSQSRSFSDTLVALFQKGVRYSTIIDIGCADGHFYLSHYAAGLFPNTTILNIDANPLYENSLREIRDVMGGHYFIGAISDAAGEVDMTMSAHPYWSSLRPPGDSYWSQINNLHSGTTRVPAQTLDSLCEQLGLQGRFLIKLDIQGAETAALRGASRVLRDTDVIICEADMADFQSIHETLSAAEFSLFDITALNFLPDNTLGWFYPVYVSRRLAPHKDRTFWDHSYNEQVIQAQIQRRKQILEGNAAFLRQERASRKRQ